MKKAFPALLALLCACLALLIATTSSPLYATNFWTDTNIYFTIGRGMTRGLMPYRDLFDHKGPLLFMLYALGAAVSGTSFIGVFMLEALSLAAAVYAGWRTVRLFGEGRLTLLAMPILAAVTCCCTAFTQGGSAEEFALPALAVGVYLTLAVMTRPEEETGRRMLGFGAAAGWVFLIKYTDIGLFVGLGVCLLAVVWRRTGLLGRALISAGQMLLGALLVCAPVAAYLAANGALGACIEVYFVQNLFDYSGTPMSLTGHIYNALAYLRTQSVINPAVVLLVVLGAGFVLLGAAKRHEKGMIGQALALPMGAGLLLLTCYWGEMAHPYYALVFAGLCAPGLIPLAWLANRAERRGLYAWALPLAGVLAIVPTGLGLCRAVPLMRVNKTDMPQTVFAEIMNREENPTLLDITSLDQGFYLAAGIVPNCRYFADNNLQTQEKKDAIASYLAEGKTQFVVTRYADPGERYELIAEADGVFDLNDRRHYKLYKRIEENDGALPQEGIHNGHEDFGKGPARVYGARIRKRGF